MGKRGRSSNKEGRNPKRRATIKDPSPANSDDEIDTFIKQRDEIPLDVNDDSGESDEENEQPVFDYKDIKNDEFDSTEEDDDADMDGDADYAKIKRQLKHLRAVTGGVEGQLEDSDDEQDDENNEYWQAKYVHGQADNEMSDEDGLAMEEEEVIRMRKEKLKKLSVADYGIEEADDGEATIEEMLAKGTTKSSVNKEVQGDDETIYRIKKDPYSLSKEEQLDLVSTASPELIDLLSELNDAIEQLETVVNPLLRKVNVGENTKKGGTNYLEMKQLLLLAYCQAIVFYLLLKSEGRPVRDHPVIDRLVEIKNLLDKTRPLDEYLPSKDEEILIEEHGAERRTEVVKEKVVLSSDSLTINCEASSAPDEMQQAEVCEISTKAVERHSSKDDKDMEQKWKAQNDRRGVVSKDMLKLKASLVKKLQRKGVFGSSIPNTERVQKHNSQPLNGQLETFEDFDDMADVNTARKGLNNGNTIPLASKLSQLVIKAKKPKVVSGDDDLPRRDDIGERRRKHELRVLSRTGTRSEDDAGNKLSEILDGGDADLEVSEMEESEDELYKQVKRERELKLAAKAEIYSRTSVLPSLPETVDGKRQISYQIEKNRGLTRARKKLTKNPRKKYRTQHDKAKKRRKGQVRDIKKPSGPYGGEATGINTATSRSIRFKN